jgi:hypothetical protein
MKPFELTVEQEFNIIAFGEQVKALSREQAQQMLVELYRSMMVKESTYKSFLVQQLGGQKS